MNSLVHVIFLLVFASATAFAFDESINFQPGLNLFNEASQLTDLIGPRGSELCAPISITHGMTYLKYSVGFSSLATVPDMDHDGVADTYRDKIRYFFATCKSDINNGTHYHEAEACMRQYIEQSGYKSYVYIVGPHAIDAPPGVALPTMQHTLTVQDVRTYVGHRLMVLMGVGWYNYNATTNTYTRIGGHYFNVYGYDYNNAWGEQQLTLKVVNSLVNYSGRDAGSMFDSVQMTAVPHDGTMYPTETAFAITGDGFNFQQKSLVEDIFVALPLAP